MESTTLSILPVYFDKYFDIANGIAHAGLSFGVMVMSPLTQFFLEIYGWRGTMIIIAAFNAHTIAIGALLKPVPTLPDSSQSKLSSHNIIAHSKSRRNQLNIIKTIVETFDLDFFKNSTFASVMCATFGNGFYYTGWLIYLVPHAKDLGFSPYAASALATSGGVGNLVGSCAFPIVSKVFSSKRMIYIFHLLASVSLAIDPIFSLGPYYTGLMASSFLLNFANGVWNCAINKVCAEVLPKSSYHSSLNWAFFNYGIASVISGFISGMLSSLRISED